MRVRALFIAGLAALAVASPAQAATWQVTGTGDGGTCDPKTFRCDSLRAAIAASEATKEDADTINVPAGVINVNNDLVIQSDITVNGANARTTIIDGGFKYRGFRVAPSGNAKISHLTVRNGAAGQGDSLDGGGILNFSGVVQLNTVRVTGSHAPGRGGGIANFQGTLTLVNGLVDNNTADDGAGISNWGGAESPDRGLLGIATTTIFKNTAGIGGTGGISSRGGQLNVVLLNFSTLADNVGGVRGVGGMLIQSGAAQVVGDLIARNTVAGEGVVNCGPTRPVDSGGNLEDDKDCIDAGGGLDPDLATALRNEGGELDVLPIGEKSQALDRNTTSCTAPDARGLGRPQGAGCDSGAFEIDQAPTVTISAGPSGTVSTPDVQFTFASTEPGVSYQCQLTGPGQTPGFTTCESPRSYNGLANGAYTFSVRAMDGEFPNPPVTTRSFTVAALDTTITGGPPNPTNDTTPTFTFIGVNGAAGFQCRVDTGTFTGCTSPHTTAELSPGTHTFQVRALGPSGAPDPTPASQAFVIDTTAPNTTINSGPNGSLSSTSATFTFSSNEAGSSFQCSLDGAAFGPCPVNYTGLSQGSHTFAVRATDPAGNTDGSPDTRTWTVDTVAPDTNITGGPSGTVSSTSATFAFTSTETGSTFQCSLDSAAFAACPASYTGLSQGSHTFQVRAVDAAGNPDSSPASRTWIVDTVAPDTNITGGPTGSVSSTSATFTFTSTETGSTFQCSLDSAAFAACPASYTGLSQGSHTFQVRAVDAAGNPDSSPASRTWTVDTTAPDTNITGGPTGTVNSTSATFTFTSNEGGATFQCSLDSAAFGVCPASYTGLSQGSHTFQVRAVDAAGNMDASPASRTWTVDTGDPETTITAGPTGPTNVNPPTFSFISSEAGSTFQCRVDTGAFTTCTSPHTTASLSQGAHTFEVRAIDSGGNTDETPASRSIVTDTVAPPAPVITTPANNALLIANTISFQGTAEIGATVQVREGATVVGSAIASGTGNWTIVLGAVPDGAHTYEARATDAATNTSGATSRTVTVDTGLPDTTITGGPSGPTNDDTPTFTFSSEAGATFECSLDGVAHTACPNPFTTPQLGPGAHTLSVRAVDLAGNRDNTPATRTFTVDTAAPDTTINTGPSGTTSNTTPQFTFSATETGATFECRLDTPSGDGTFQSCSSPRHLSTTAQGAYTFHVRATDTAGNIDPSPATRTFTIDITAPNTTIDSGPNGPTNDTAPTFTFTSEPGATFECSVDGGTFATCASPHTTATLSVGAHTFAVRAVDPAGNRDATPATNSFTVDTSAPPAPVITSPANGTAQNTQTITLSGTAEVNATVEVLEGTTSRGTTTANGTGVWTHQIASVPEGSHTYTATARDAAGNVSGASAGRTVIVDLTAPAAPVITSPAENAVLAATTLTLTGTAEAGSTVEIREGATLRGTGTATGGNWSVQITDVAEGTHTYTARVTDAASNTGPGASRTIRIDITAPVVIIDSGPPNPTNGPNLFQFHSTEAGVTFECRLDGPGRTDTFQLCTPPAGYGGLSDGTFTFRVRARDAAGTLGPEAIWGFRLDTTDPAPPTVTTPANGARFATDSVRFQGLAEARATVRLREGTTTLETVQAGDAGAWVIDLNGIADGIHTYTLTATDEATNESEDVTRVVHVDTGAPAAPAITGGPSGPINTTSAQFSFTGEAGATFECVLDTGELEPCVSPKTYEGLSEGNHLFGVRQIDAAGNGGDTATRAFSVDLTPPAPPAVVSGPEGATTNASPAFGFTSEAGTIVECSLDGPVGAGAFAPCASPQNFSGLAPGAYTFHIRSTDAAGNQRTTSRSFSVTNVLPAQTPTPTPTPTPTATPTPVPNQSVVVGPARGTVRVKVKGSNRFEDLDITKGIPLGSEVDVRKGRVTLTAIPRRGGQPETAAFYSGMFIVTQKGGITDLKLSEPLDCSKKRAQASRKKAKKRKLWGKGSGKFRTTGSYSAATVRGTTWLVQDTCTTTLTRVTQGVVSVRDKVKRKTVLVKKGKRYTAKKRR